MSKQPRKQRKRLYKSPLHRREKVLRSTLSKELRKELGTRSIRVRTGDLVRIMRGKWRGHEGKVIGVDVAHGRVYVEGVTLKRSDGTEVPYPIHPSNLMILELESSDKRRFRRWQE